MDCPHCAASIRNDASFCHACGGEISHVAEQEQGEVVRHGSGLRIHVTGPDYDDQKDLEGTEHAFGVFGAFRRRELEGYLDRMSAVLARKGWELLPLGAHWYSRRFRRPVPLARRIERRQRTAQAFAVRRYDPFDVEEWSLLCQVPWWVHSCVGAEGGPPEEAVVAGMLDSLPDSPAHATLLGHSWVESFQAAPDLWLRLSEATPSWDGLDKVARLLDRLPDAEATAIRDAIIELAIQVANGPWPLGTNRQPMYKAISDVRMSVDHDRAMQAILDLFHD